MRASKVRRWSEYARLSAILSSGTDGPSAFHTANCGWVGTSSTQYTLRTRGVRALLGCMALWQTPCLLSSAFPLKEARVEAFFFLLLRVKPDAPCIKTYLFRSALVQCACKTSHVRARTFLLPLPLLHLFGRPGALAAQLLVIPYIVTPADILAAKKQNCQIVSSHRPQGLSLTRTLSDNVL